MRARLGRWVLLSGHRYAVAGGVLVLMTGVVLVPAIARFAVRNTSPLSYLASTLITGNLTLITVAVAINHLVLSQELESPDSLRDEIEGTAEYRHAALDEPVAPTEPSDFLRRLLEQTRQHALSLEEFVPGPDDEANDRLLRDLPDHCEQVRDQLERTTDDLSHLVVPLLGTDYGDYIRDCHRLRTGHEETSHRQLHAVLEDLTSDLENVDVARQYFTTAFVKEELATLSRSLLYVGVLAVSTPIALLVQLTTYAGATPPVPGLFALAVLAAVFGLTPLALLIAFVLRIAMVDQRIASITPFNA